MSLSFATYPEIVSRPAFVVGSVVVAGSVAGIAVATGNGVYLLPVLALLMALRWPVQVALGAYAFLTPFEQFPVIGVAGAGTSPTWFAGVLALVMLLAVGLMDKRFEPPPKAAFWWMLFVAWGMFTIGWSVAPEVSLARLRTALSLLILYVLATSFRTTKSEFNTIKTLTIWGGVTAAVISIVQTFSGVLFSGTHRGTIVFHGTEADPNYFASSLMIPFALAVGQVIENRGIRRTMMVGASLTLTLSIILTGSRGGMLGLLTCVFVFLVRMKIDRRIVALVLSAAMLLAFLPSSFLDRLTKADDAGAGRLAAWTIGMKAFPHYMLQGAGWDNFATVFMDYSGGVDALAMGHGRGPHNLWVGMAVEVGLPGIIFLFIAIQSQLRKRRGRKLTPFVAGCWGMLITGMFLDVAWRNAFWLVWILLAIATRMQSREEVMETVE